MSVYREQEHSVRQEKKPRDSSVSKKPKRTESIDRRPIITQEKPVSSKPSGTSLKEREKVQAEKIKTEKKQKRAEIREDKRKNVEKGKKSNQNVGPVKAKRYEQDEIKLEEDYKLNEMYLKDLLAKRQIRKSNPEKNVGEKMKEKPVKNFNVIETIKKKEKEERKSKTRRDRTRTRTLSPTEVKQLIPSKLVYELGSGDIKAKVESREKTREAEVEHKAEEDEEEYLDDFEEYDSDFEEENDVESQKSSEKLPPQAIIKISPELETIKSSDIENKWKIDIERKKLEAVKKSIEKENYNLLERRKSVTKTLEDDSDKENVSLKKTASVLIDFSSASRKQKKTKKAAASKKRGEELLNMISLDTISYSILEIPPIPYDEFMKVFGKSNTKQVFVQTNEDNLNEEIQTDEILHSNKWTQIPAEYLGRQNTGNKTPFLLTKEERLGVGGDFPLEEEITVQAKTTALWNFLSWASQSILMALEKKSGNFLSQENMPNHSKAMAFGDGFVNLNVSDVPFLKGRSVTHLSLPSKNATRLLSVHTNKEKLFQKCMICIWSLRELSKPLKVLLANNRVISCCFGLNQGNLVFAGLSDGSICLWDLREPSAFHNRTANSPEWSLQSPTYTTAGNLKDGHSSPVVAVRLLSKAETSSRFKDFTPIQICSLDKDGTIIIWTVVQLENPHRSTPLDDLGLAHWGKVKLVKNSSFSVFSSLRDEIPGLYITCNDILINEVEDDGFYVANSLGSINHCSSYGFPMKPKFFVPSKQDAIIEITCLELCPFNGNYFLVGCGDGTIRLHSRHQENPLICLNSNIIENEKEAPIVSLNWMRMRPCVFFALDSMSRINIWDLEISDMYPEISLVLTEKKIACMRLLSVSDPRQVPFIVIGTEGGSIEIHKLKKEYGCRTANEVQNEMKMFLKYVSIL